MWAFVSKFLLFAQVFLVRKILGPDAGQLYAMKVLKKASLKGKANLLSVCSHTKDNTALIVQISSMFFRQC